MIKSVSHIRNIKNHWSCLWWKHTMYALTIRVNGICVWPELVPFNNFVWYLWLEHTETSIHLDMADIGTELELNWRSQSGIAIIGITNSLEYVVLAHITTIYKVLQSSLLLLGINYSRCWLLSQRKPQPITLSMPLKIELKSNL